jgi:paraquat-inducible protein B
MTPSRSIFKFIGPRYVPLVRETSKPERRRMHDLSLFGLEVRALSLKSLMVGGIAFATPDHPGQPASSGLEFRLYEKPKDEWLAWLPKISLRAQEK